MSVQLVNVAGWDTVRQGSTRVHCKFLALLCVVPPKGLQLQGNP
jgi:hypothetical protein